MQCTVPPPPSATPPRPPLAVSPRSLLAAFAPLPDPRRARSVTYALPALLALAVAAILSNHLSVLAIAEWGARQSPDLLRTLGCPTGRTPCQSTLQRLFSKLDGHALSAVLAAHFAPAVVPVPAAAEADATLQGVAMDGKAQRGRLPFQQGGCPVHALTAFCHEHGVVLAHEPIEPGQGAEQEKGEAELTVAPALLARVAWPGRVLTGDALFCQRHLCQQVLAAGGEYLLLVKENQPTLYEDIRLLFDPPPSLASLPLLDQREARTRDRGHGRQDDVRQLVASTDLNGYVEWPGLAQVFRLRRTWREHGQTKQALHYGITSLRPEAGPPERLLALKRGHWRIENDLHRVKDVSLGEDQSLIHQGHGPTIMALLREAALSLLHRAGIRQISARLRYHSQHPAAAVALLAAPLPADA
jgi:predicted transposase YbfD/YdcC